MKSFDFHLLFFFEIWCIFLDVYVGFLHFLLVFFVSFDCNQTNA
jgi:hypothetical protein